MRFEKDFWPCECHLVHLSDLRGHDDLQQGGILSSRDHGESPCSGNILLTAEYVQRDEMSNADWVNFHSCKRCGSGPDNPLSGYQRSLQILFHQRSHFQFRRRRLNRGNTNRRWTRNVSMSTCRRRKLKHVTQAQKICDSYEWTRIGYGS